MSDLLKLFIGKILLTSILQCPANYLLSAPMGFKNKQRYVWDNKSSKILTVSSSSTYLSRAAAASEREKCNASSSESKVYPQSLSISSMLRLGRLVSKTMEAPKGIEIF